MIVFTHSTEFYQELINCSIGNGAIKNSGCGICRGDGKGQSKNTCHGFKDKDHKVYKCGNYYKLETAIQPGLVKDEIEFFRMNYEQRLEVIRKEILNGNTSNLSDMLRTTINNFYEHYVLRNIKKQVFIGEDLLNFNDKLRIDEFTDDDYDRLKQLHSELSGKGTMHENSIENKTPLDLKGFIEIYNRLVSVIQNYRPNVGEKIKRNSI